MSSDPTASPPPAQPATTGEVPPPDPNRIDWSPYNRLAILGIVVGILLYAAAGMLNMNAAEQPHEREHAKARFVGAYLSGYTFWLSLPIGGMALLMIGHLATASWQRFLRRFFEAATRTWPLLFVLWIPLVIAVAASPESHLSPYWWTEPEKAETDPTVNSANPAAGVEHPDNKRDVTVAYGKYMINKAVEHEREGRERGNFGFLSVTGFIGVGIVLFAIWAVLIYFLNKWSREAQGSRQQVDASLNKLFSLSGPGIIIYAITITAAATQWVMSLEPGWSSTMFPVIFAVNQFLTCYALCLALFLVMASRSPIKERMRPKFQLDMATLLLAFTLFWTYTSFSQFMLVWIGNLPEEIPFFLKRSVSPTGEYGFWWWVSAGLAVLHFALPFLLLLFRDVKLHPKRLRWVATYLLLICGVDVIWWIAPASPQPWNLYALMDVGAVLAVGGVWALFFFWQLKQRDIIPTDENHLLPEGHHHEHH